MYTTLHLSPLVLKGLIRHTTLSGYNTPRAFLVNQMWQFDGSGENFSIMSVDKDKDDQEYSNVLHVLFRLHLKK